MRYADVSERRRPRRWFRRSSISSVDSISYVIPVLLLSVVGQANGVPAHTKGFTDANGLTLSVSAGTSGANVLRNPYPKRAIRPEGELWQS